MDFFARQQEVQRKSRAFFAAFGLAMAVTVVIMYFGFIAGLLLTGAVMALFGAGSVFLIFMNIMPPLFSLPSFLIISSVITAVILTVSYRKIKTIKAGGGAYMAELLGGELLQAPADINERRLINVVEEMAVASGLPRPRLYVLRNERSINAVTAGLEYDDAVIVVTGGALTYLNREELQAVMAHEFAHILNGDFSLNLTMAGWLYGLFFIALKGEELMDSSRDCIDRNIMSNGLSRNEGSGFIIAGGLWAAGLAAYISGLLSRTAGEIVQTAFSRQREYLADAFAVQFTRNAPGLAGALKKIAAFPRRGIIRHSNAAIMKAFFIASPDKADNWLATHPPLEKRILALEPAWDGALPEMALQEADIYRPKELKLGPAKLEAFNDKSKSPPLSPAAMKRQSDWAETLTSLGLLAVGGAKGVPASPDLQAGTHAYENLPETLRRAADDPVQAAALTLAVLADEKPEVRERQWDSIRRHLGEETATMAAGLSPLIEESHKFPLLSLLPPTLKGLKADQIRSLGRAVKELVAADGRLDLFEIAAYQMLKGSLGLRTGKPERGVHVADYLKSIQKDAVTVLSVMARLSPASPEEPFAAGMAKFTQWPRFSLADKSLCTSGELLRALDRLGEAPAAVKTMLITGAATTATFDHELTGKEYKLLRALAAALEMPLPLLKMNA